MSARYTDEEIHQMLNEQKPLPENYHSRFQFREKRGHKERELDIKGVSGNPYRLILRQSNFNKLDFSVILALNPSDSNLLFRLRRYNGKSHEHTNLIEENTFYDFHIHSATERYQETGSREDAFAEATVRFTDFQSALDCMLEDCGFVMPQGDQQIFIFSTEPDQ
jgi:hypothetical protein